MKVLVDITGQRFGKLTAKYPSGRTKHGSTKWHCRCDCGREKDVELSHLKSGGTKSCGKCSRTRYDLTGEKFGRLTVRKRSTKRIASGNAVWICDCDCGNVKEFDGYQLRHGEVQSCGCLRKEKAIQKIHENTAMLARMGNANNFRDSFGNPIQTTTASSRNTSGVVGVSFDESMQRWVARMMVKGHMVLNTTFSEFDDAVEARRQAERKYLKK